jgi:hypothetical protein
MKRFLLGAALVAAMSGVSFGEDEMRQFFPKPQEIAGWTISGDVSSYPGQKIFDLIDGAGEVFMAYNFDTASSAEYTGAGNTAIDIEIYRMKTVEDAYGIYSYTYYRGAKPEKLDVGQAGFVSGVTAGFWKDVYYVKVYGLEDKPGVAAAVKEFAASIAGKIPKEGNLPDYFKVLEVEGLQKGTTTYVHSDLALKNLHFVSEENSLNLGDGAYMLFADFKVKERTFQAFVAFYPSEAEAAAAATKYAKFMGSHKESDVAWFKQAGKAIAGTWTGYKQGQTVDAEQSLYNTIENLLTSIRAYLSQK